GQAATGMADPGPCAGLPGARQVKEQELYLKKVSIIVGKLDTTAWTVAEGLARYEAMHQEEKARRPTPTTVAVQDHLALADDIRAARAETDDEADQAADGTFAAQLADLQSRLEDMASAFQTELAQLADMVAARVAAAEARYARPRHPYENVERDYEAGGE